MSSSKQPAISEKREYDDFDIASALDLLMEHRLLISIVLVLFILLGTLYAFVAVPVYETDITVQVEDSPDSAAKSLLGDLSSMFDVKSNTDSEIQILGSRLVVSRAVDELRLYIKATPKRFPLIGGWVARRAKSLSQPGILGIGGYTWGTEKIEVEAFDVPSDLYQHEYTVTFIGDGQFLLEGEDLGRGLRGKVGTALAFKTSAGAARLVVRSISAEAGAVFRLQRFSRLQTIEDVQKHLKISSVGKDADVIAASMEGRDPERITATLSEIGNQYVKQNADRKAAQAEQSLRFLAQQEPDMKRELEEAEDRYSQYRNTHGITNIDQEAKVLLQQSADLQTQLFTLRQKRQELLTRFGDQHPAVAAIDDQAGSAQTQLEGIAERIKALPLEEQGAVRLERDVRVNTDLYIALRNNMEQLRLIRAGKIGNVRIVDAAYLPETPVKPKKLLVIAASALLGLMAGIGSAWLRDRLFHGVTDPQTFETYTGLKVFATIPYSSAQAGLARKIDGLDAKSAVLATVSPSDPAIESLRSLRTALQFAVLEARNNVVIITGATPGIGKSFISVNLAELLSASKKRVLLVDADLRRGYLNQYLGVERNYGLVDVLQGKMALSAAISQSVRPNLDFLATGAFQSHASELLGDRAWSKMLEEASKRYDIVLIDAPPVLAVSDAEVIAPYAGSLFLVAKSGKTRVGEIDESLKRLDQSGARVTGLLFNGVKSRGKFSYGGKYASYRYASYDYESHS